MRTRRGGLIGLVQKANDLAGYIWRRGRMLLTFWCNRLRHHWTFRGTVSRILVVRLGSIGDVVRATAILEPLRARYPQAVIDVLTTDLPRPMIAGHPAVNTIYTLADLSALGPYDWVINLQNRDPQESFIKSSGLTYRQILAHVSSKLQARMFSGRHIRGGKEITATNILYCVAEMEELFLIALLPYDRKTYPRTRIQLGEEQRRQSVEKFALPEGRPRLALFLGSNSIGCGADEGFRTYSIGFVEQLIRHFSDRFAIVMIGQSLMRNAAERRTYADILQRHPAVVDLVDKTTLEELAGVIDRMDLLISCDSSPVHLALARGVPVVGLYVSDASFRLGPELAYKGLVGLNSSPPCFYYSWRWRFFCHLCREPSTRAAYCVNDAFVFGVDRIPLARIDQAADTLLRERDTATSGDEP